MQFLALSPQFTELKLPWVGSRNLRFNKLGGLKCESTVLHQNHLPGCKFLGFIFSDL